MAERGRDGDGETVKQLADDQLPQGAGVERLRVNGEHERRRLAPRDTKIGAVRRVAMESFHTGGIGHAGSMEVCSDAVVDRVENLRAMSRAFKYPSLVKPKTKNAGIRAFLNCIRTKEHNKKKKSIRLLFATL